MPSLPGGCTTANEFCKYVYERVRECILRYMSKEATATHLQDRYQISPGCTQIAWSKIERLNQDFFRTYFENGAPNATALSKLEKQTALDQIKEETGSCKTPDWPPERYSDKAPSIFSDTRSREKEKQVMEIVRNLLSRVPEEAANPHDGNPKVSVEQSSSKAGGQSQAIQKPKLETSPQQPHYSTAEFWQKLLTTLGQIESNTDNMAKLMSDGHGFAAHSSVVGSSTRQREDEQGKERGDNDEAEKLQDQNIQPPQQTNGQSRGNKAAKNTLED